MNPIVRLSVLALLATCVSVVAKADRPQRVGVPQETPDLSQPLSLDRAVQIGLANQHSLGIANSQLEANRARLTQSRSSYYPQIAPQFAYTNELTSIGGRAARAEDAVTSIGLRQLIFDTFKREENVAISRNSLRASEFNVLDSRQAVIVNVTTSYYDLLRQRELVRVAESSVERARTTLEATRAFAEAGTSPKKDILQAQADFDNAQVQLISARNNVRLAETTLKTAMGLITQVPLIVPDIHLDAPSPELDKRTVADYYKIATEQRPDLRRESASIEANRHNVKIANINAGVTVQADVTEGYRIDPAPGENRVFTTTFSYPLFDAGASRAAVREAKASLEQSRQQLELTRQSVQTDVEQAYLLREEARVRVGATQSALRAANENYEAAREAQKEGAGTIIDVITAQSLLVTAETNAVQAIYDFYTSDARLQRAIGTNDPYRVGGTKR